MTPTTQGNGGGGGGGGGGSSERVPQLNPLSLQCLSLSESESSGDVCINAGVAGGDADMSKEASTARGTGDAGIAGDLKGGQERVTESEIDGSGRFAAAAGNRVAGARESSYRYPTGAWLGESHVSGKELRMESPQSMLLSADQNTIMRMPNFGSFMYQQENLQALLVDIHDDPQGFTSFVENRREGFGVLGEATVAALSSGDGRLSDYTNLQKVGKGRFSAVFYAETKGTRLPCAIKRIQLASTQEQGKGAESERTGRGLADSGGRGQGGGAIAAGRRRRKARETTKQMTYEQCLKEVGLLKNLRSPNIVKLHTCFVDENVLWVVMEWVDGGDLKGVLRRTRQAGERLNELAVWGYFTQICDALLHMHGQRIMHRDLKPANILVCMNGTVKLGDLGLGRYLHARSALAMSQVGTPLYMSPETLQGQGHEMVSDIWSLGCVLYELAMLTSPFAARHLTMDKLFSKIVRADYLPVDRTLYSERLSNLVDHLLMPDPNIRPKIDMVQPASHLALQAQRNGVQGLDVEQLAVCAGEIQQQDYRYNNTHMTPAPPLPSPPIPCNSPVSRAGGGDVDSDVGYRGVYHGGYGCDQEGLVIEAAVFMEQEDILRPGVDLPVSMEVEGEGEKDGEGRRASCTAIDRGGGAGGASNNNNTNSGVGGFREGYVPPPGLSSAAGRPGKPTSTTSHGTAFPNNAASSSAAIATTAVEPPPPPPAAAAATAAATAAAAAAAAAAHEDTSCGMPCGVGELKSAPRAAGAGAGAASRGHGDDDAPPSLSKPSLGFDNFDACSDNNMLLGCDEREVSWRSVCDGDLIAAARGGGGGGAAMFMTAEEGGSIGLRSS